MKTHQIVLTEKCNLNCPYCYIDQKDNAMNETVFLNILRTFDEDYKLDLFGGEPLLKWDLVKYIILACLSNSKARCMEINLYSNGLLLTQSMVDFLKKHDVNFFWSYDGIWCDYKPDTQFVKQLTDRVSVQIGPNNLNLAENYEHYVKMGFTPSFSLIRDNVWNDEDIEKFKVEFRKLCNSYERRLQHLPEIIRMTISKLQEGLINRKPYPNCGAGETMFGYMPDGSKFPCARFGTLDHVETVDGLFDECNNCYLNYSCDKGCYHQAVLNNGPVNSICELYKIIASEVIDLNKRLKGNAIWQMLIKKMIVR